MAMPIHVYTRWSPTSYVRVNVETYLVGKPDTGLERVHLDASFRRGVAVPDMLEEEDEGMNRLEGRQRGRVERVEVVLDSQ